MVTDFRLKVFRAVAERLSFTRAAEELFITQPAVTKHINELERQLGVSLFHRRGNTIALTPQGERLLQYARRILSLYREMGSAFTDEQSAFEGSITLGASTTLAQYILPALLAQFHRRYPGIRIGLHSGNTQQIEQWILEEKLDFGVIEGNASQPQLHYTPFLEDELVLTTAVANRTLAQEEITPADLPSLRWVIRETGSGTLDVIERALEQHGISFRQFPIEMRLGSTEGIKRYLIQSEAVAFLSLHAIDQELRHNLLRIVEIEGLRIPRKFHFVMRHGYSERLSALFIPFCLSSYNL
ncbi:MAG: LysR substrate-binding domain-containing protein [Alistipes sp.]|nr:LysR substrate-binding domain-containing protein [Alistipes sp.]